jgi:hypothetical protein
MSNLINAGMIFILFFNINLKYRSLRKKYPNSMRVLRIISLGPAHLADYRPLNSHWPAKYHGSWACEALVLGCRVQVPRSPKKRLPRDWHDHPEVAEIAIPRNQGLYLVPRNSGSDSISNNLPKFFYIYIVY